MPRLQEINPPGNPDRHAQKAGRSRPLRTGAEVTEGRSASAPGTTGTGRSGGPDMNSELFGEPPTEQELSALREKYGNGAVAAFLLEVDATADRHAQSWHSMAGNLRNMGGGSVGERRGIATRILWGTWRRGGYHGTVQPHPEQEKKNKKKR
jgi:hypothetical protein